MKKCPFCAEEIQAEAIKCKHCGEFLKKMTKWYFKPVGMILIFLTIGPLALPLVWLNPELNKKKKIFITILALGITLFLMKIVSNSVTSIMKYYDLMFNLQ